jgi:hypothetical protein
MFDVIIASKGILNNFVKELYTDKDTPTPASSMEPTCPMNPVDTREPMGSTASASVVGNANAKTLFTISLELS